MICRWVPLSLFLLLRAQPAAADPVEVCFVPSETSCTAVVVREIAAAKISVKVQAYNFSSLAIEQALVDAHERGIDVQVILDRSNEHAKYSGLGLMEKAHVPTWIDAKEAIAHNKVVVCDHAVVITGSFNFSVGAQKRNAENLIVLHDAELVAKYEKNMELHRAHSKAAP